MLLSSTSENRPYVYTLQYWAFNLSMIIGALFGGFLFQTHRFEIYLSVLLGSVLSVILLLFFIKETHHPSQDTISKAKTEKTISSIIKDYKVVFRDLTFMKFAFASLLIYSIDAQARSYAGVRLADEFGSQTITVGAWSFAADGFKMYGLLTAENCLVVVTIALLVKQLIYKYNKRTMLYAGILLYAIGYSFVGVTNSALLLIIMMFVATFGELMWLPIQQSMMAELPPESNRGAYMAVNGLISHGMNIMGAMAIFIGAFIPSWSMSMLFLLSGIFSILLYERNMKQMKGRVLMSETV